MDLTVQGGQSPASYIESAADWPPPIARVSRKPKVAQFCTAPWPNLTPSLTDGSQVYYKVNLSLTSDETSTVLSLDSENVGVEVSLNYAQGSVEQIFETALVDNKLMDVILSDDVAASKLLHTLSADLDKLIFETADLSFTVTTPDVSSEEPSPNDVSALEINIVGLGELEIVSDTQLQQLIDSAISEGDTVIDDDALTFGSQEGPIELHFVGTTEKVDVEYAITDILGFLNPDTSII